MLRPHAVAVIVAAGTVVALPTAGVAQESVRFATFNVSMSPGGQTTLESNLANTTPAPFGFGQGRNNAEVIQRLRPDVLLLNEFNYNPANPTRAVDLFRQNFLQVSQNGQAAITYPYAYVAPVNTGVQSGFDLNNNGNIGDPEDAFGFGNHPGQFGMVVLSKYPITGARTFQEFLWKDMPGARLPDDPSTPAPADWYSAAELDVFRLSSKSHWDLTVDVNGNDVHVLASHPTPPVFDAVQLPGFPTDPFAGNLVDYNGKRNADEIRLWDDYITPGDAAYLYDDAGNTGGLAEGASFVIMGDLNADPVKGDGIQAAIQSLLSNPRVNDTVPVGAGGDDPTDTATFDLRVDYVLPSSDLGVTGSGVFWPTAGQPGFSAINSTDHRMVYVDVVVPEPASLTLPGVAAGLLRRRRQSN
ncbi:MAG: endonuclease/exonuclease/phosphatase family protein [Phycisphaerae bacterium]